MNIILSRTKWSMEISVGEDGVSIAAGKFGGLSVLPSPLFHMQLEDKTGASYNVDASTGWNGVRCIWDETLVKFWLTGPVMFGDITVVVTGRIDDRGISWHTDVINASSYSVSEISYPVPIVQGKPLHLFSPERCGRLIEDAGEKGYHKRADYPGSNMTMQYFAFWGNEGGIYLGLHDPDACTKHFSVDVAENVGRLELNFPGIGAGEPANSFPLGGEIRWEFLSGDWYDATMLYADFVHNHAKWLPVKGRPDTPQKFKEIAYWICDYIPNSEQQRDARPMTLAAVSERYGERYWVDAPILLRKRLGVPVGYHVYNWHEIPFNINYPHFLPARETARKGMEKLKEAGLYLFPYINAVSWEMDDAEEGFAENFSNVGIHGAALLKDGKPYFVPYPQKKIRGQDTRLAPICPTFTRWHQLMDAVARGIEASLPVDGIYFDQVASVPAQCCRNPEHTHRPGGGSYWPDHYNMMMERINARKPDDKFYFTEDNAEAYVKSFDGFLTWIWHIGDDVPAFPAIYAGYIQMLGRYTDGAKRDDDAYFRYQLAESLLFGQQLGWLNADVVYKEERMRFLEKVVHARYAYTALFNEGRLLRPPVVETNILPVTSSDITMRQVVAGVWQTEDRSKTVLFVVNVSPHAADAAIRLYPQEYGISCPESIQITLEPMSVQIMEF